MATENAKRAAHAIAEQYELALVVLFGSIASGKERKESDIDIAVLREDRAPLSTAQFFAVDHTLLETFGETFSRVDLVDLARANILLRYEIVSGGILLAGDEDTYESYRRFAFRDYVDSQSLRDLEKILINKRQAELKNAINA